ncbi:exopolyphosphatase / guanosine-5'-triphosphate,3'-diphosphate pyrophosphatase [Rhizobium sp. NFR07]|uniref:Ppx/GppA phosphatase family protein n=1 Tax=Rhizobium sp. NFR07 TaxID=1566262 RepID=UPI0008E2F06C|nr:Ppx/GppA phosphatase family protein [Rhizobium sp. NFR07]SFB09025.1 exopolyphosphatase / guanosine-5'-triphosphate,3'-diphosphate pyrophosphatase [Rhizobium sp. NFR07]
MDPDSGRVPQNGGASAAEGGAGKPSRRRKGKRGGKNRNASASPHASSAPSAENAARLEAKQDHPARKRKRRRSRSDRPANPDTAAAPSAAPVRAEQDQRQNSAQPGNAVKAKGRDRRKKNRGGRGLQGRPLAQGQGNQGQGSQGRGNHGHAQGSAKDAHARDALNGVSQPALLRANSPHAAERANGAAMPGQHGFEAALPFRDDLYAALDLGTNNCRLLIAQPTRPGHFRVVDAFSRIVRLGEGLAATGRLSADAMDRAVEALRICASKLSAKPIRKMRLIATEACRAAANGEEFLARVTAETGLDLEIIDRETEARLAVSGCSSLVGREARSIVLFDIGGGSSEIAVIRIGDNRSSRLANHITHWTSLPVGVVTLSERHGGRDVTPDVFEAMVVEVEGMLAKFDCPPIGSARRNPDHDFHLIGTSGTVTTLAGVHLDLPRYDRRRVDGLWLSDAEVSAMQAKLLSWDFAGRAANPCIGPDRADLVLAGCAILEAIRRRWPSNRMRVADRGLREGLLTDMMADDGVWRRGRSRRAANGGTEEGLKRR